MLRTCRSTVGWTQTAFVYMGMNDIIRIMCRFSVGYSPHEQWHRPEIEQRKCVIRPTRLGIFHATECSTIGIDFCARRGTVVVRNGYERQNSAAPCAIAALIHPRVLSIEDWNIISISFFELKCIGKPGEC